MEHDSHNCPASTTEDPDVIINNNSSKGIKMPDEWDTHDQETIWYGYSSRPNNEEWKAPIAANHRDTNGDM